jgi:Flp pilus assembly protein TadG
MMKERTSMLKNTFNENKGIALIEFCFILPILVVMVLFIIDFGRLIQARIIITNVAREGGNIASRGIETPAGTELIPLLQSSATPLDLQQYGRICVTKVDAALPPANPDPSISSQQCSGNLAVSSGISSGADRLGLTSAMYNHLVFKVEDQASDINGITVVETFYKYRPITPLPNFIANIFLTHGDGTIVGSKSVYCTTF